MVECCEKKRDDVRDSRSNSERGETTSRSEFVITYSACELIEARGNIILFHFTRGLSEVRNWNFRKIVYDLG